MVVLKHTEQKHKPIDKKKDIEPRTGDNPEEALAGLCRALESEEDFALLTGPAGSGKSTIVRGLLPSLTCMVCRVTVPDKEMTPQDFRRFLAEALCLETNVQSRGAFLLKIRDFLMSEAVKDNRIVFVLESIECLDRKLFKELELLSDISIDDRNPITYLFVGLTEAEPIFSDPYLAKIANRIRVKIRLEDASCDDASCDDAGTFDDVRRHIRERLQKAGAPELVFDVFAVREVYRLSQGRLWAVDGLCDLALLNGALHGLKKIPVTVVDEYARQLGLPVTGDDDRESFQRNLESVRRKLQSTLNDKARLEPDAAAVDENSDQVETLVQRRKDRDIIQPNRVSARRKPQSRPVRNGPSEPGVRTRHEGVPPLDSGPEPDAETVVVNQFQEGDWEDRALMHYIDGAPLRKTPVRQRSKEQWYDSSMTFDRSIDDDLERGPVAGGSELNRSSFLWGALSVISVILVFFAVWIRFFDESGALLRFFTDTAVKIESTLLSAWRGVTGDPSTDTAAKPSSPPSETDAPESADPASPGRDGAADALSLETGAMVLFDSDSYVIDPEYARLLDRVAAYLERHPLQRVSLKGYSDNIGERDYNLFISKYRALVVKYYLIEKGVPAERMQILGMGEGNPVGSNDTPEGRRYNRRVEIKLIPGSSPDPESGPG
jgi:outer membrane protein OmpA-like peptidoglycan-associated protein/type II secretory pathway predicted ATPase ExeA